MIKIENINLIYFLPLISIILTILFYLLFQKIKSIINIYDCGDLEKRKIHFGNIPPIGGVLFYLIFILYFLINIFFDFENVNFFTFKERFTILFSTSIIFITGLIDDKYGLNASKKSVIFIFVIFFVLLNNPSFNVEFLRFETLKKTYALGEFTFFFTFFCIFSFMNAFNMYDGINLQSGLYLFLFFIIFTLKGIENIFFISLLIPLVLFLYNNYKSRIFLGNNGTYFLSFLISIYLIKSNITYSMISVEEIFILLLVPGFDMARLFTIRFCNGKSPFLPDNNHIHHLLLKKYDQFKVAIILTMLTIIPYLIYSLFVTSIFIIILQVTILLILVYRNRIKVT